MYLIRIPINSQSSMTSPDREGGGSSDFRIDFGLIVMRIRWILTFLWITLLACPGCSSNPATGKRQLNFVTTSQEISQGAQAAPQFLRSYGGPIPSQAIQQYVSNLGKNLAAVSERTSLPWEFHVVDSLTINAFALPGGKVFITRGLISKLDNEAQLAGVIGHEIGHVTAQHIGQQMTRALLLQGVTIGLGIATQHSDKKWLRTLGVGAQLGGTIYLLKFSREQETEADKLGIRYMARLGYNPSAQLQVMEILDKESSQQQRTPEFLSTHPLPRSRIKQLEKHLLKYPPNHNTPDAYSLHTDRFQTTVLDRIKKLPPAKHRN